MRQVNNRYAINKLLLYGKDHQQFPDDAKCDLCFIKDKNYKRLMFQFEILGFKFLIELFYDK